MGWYESPNHEGAMVGDEAFDTTHELLERLAALYQRELQRLPTLAELKALLEIELHVAGSKFVDDLETAAVVELAIKTKKKPKDQPYGVGDVFAIPLDGRHLFGRIMLLDKMKGMLIEVFREQRDTPGYRSSIVESGRLNHPMLMAGGALCFKNWRWLVVHHTEGYETPREVEKLEFVARDPHGKWWFQDIGGKKLREVPEEEARALSRRGQDSGFKSPETVEDILRKVLGES